MFITYIAANTNAQLNLILKNANLKTFYSNGKLLITAEYLVLDGAQALAVPTIYGQFLEISESKHNEIHWKSYNSDKSIWYEANFLKDDVLNKKTDFENPVTNTLIEILHHADKQNPKIIAESKGFKIETKLNFPKDWGLGTSSTLINNMAQWFEIDAFELLKKAFGGSGYDIACAQHNMPVIYQLQNGKPVVKPTSFNPHFKEHIYFVYLNQKQSSKVAIANYLTKKTTVINLIDKINLLTQIIATTADFDEFCAALQTHEKELSHILESPTVQQQLFSDFDGTIKSLGAWGGDFIMAVSEKNPTDYFYKKGFCTVIGYDKMVL